MNYYTIAPSPILSPYVRFFWVLESDEPYCHRSVADGCVEMIFHYKGLFNEITTPGKSEQSFTSGLHGPSQNFRRFTIDRGFGIFGIYLYPFAIPHLFSIPANELSDQMPDLESLTGPDGRELEEKIILASNNSQRVSILSSWLEKKILKNKAVQQPAFVSIISNIIHSKTLRSVDELAKRSFLSMRQFERNFKIFSGFSPKLYSRIIRFQFATQQYGTCYKTLTDIAYDCGYYDQSHFIHDFKQFSGYHPKQYFSGKAEGVEWKESYS
ncbi:helix-turn-helix domain-containing protein [Terrimonas pollutisoli]|uniref:helix-turn-helix domain-containing protein n=1 Tax=Terrimonas pollutisoli TaxID=3034147 RepID=UPI0023EC5C2B|nr:AraC family transcriptional regulator [Terrimonas sp. H1YJ31]